MVSIRRRGARRHSKSKRRQLRRRQQARAWRARRRLRDIDLFCLSRIWKNAPCGLA